MNRTLASAARRLNSRARARKQHLPPLILVTDEKRLPDPQAAMMNLPPGSGVIFRHYGEPNRAALAAKLRTVARRRRLIFIVAGDARLAARLQADGVHWRESDLAGPRPVPARPMIATASAHSIRALYRAKRRGVDAVLLGPVFMTASHPGRAGLGAIRFRLLARTSPLPVYALGGITPENALALLGSTAVGIAALGALAL